MCAQWVSMKCVTSHINRLADKKKKKRVSTSLGHTTGVNKMNKTRVLVVNIVWCRTSAAQPHTHTQTSPYKTPLHIYSPSHTHIWSSMCGHGKKQNLKHTHTYIYVLAHTHTPAAVERVQQACWVAVSTSSAAMATSSMAIDSAAKWVRVCECDNLV